ncbi:MAG: hypothetical protein ACPGRC_06995 [Salibacteraceae bacterium]
MKAALVLSCVFFSNDVCAQLYSNGIQNISGNKVGVGINSPQASLHIKDFSGPLIGGGKATIPLIRLQSTDPNMLPLAMNQSLIHGSLINCMMIF